jgi:hypothetical protein
MKIVSMKKSVIGIVAVGLVSMISPPLNASLTDSFESVPGSTDGTGDFDPLANNNPHGANVNGPINEATPEGIQVRTSAVAPGAPHGNQYLRISEGDFYIPFLFPEIGNSQAFTLSFRVNNSNSNGLNLQIGRINGSPGPNIGFSNISLENGQIRRLRHSSEGSGWANITGFTPGQWDHIALAYEPSGTSLGTFDLFINDFVTPVAAGLLVNNSGFSPPLNNIFFGTRGGSQDVYIDQIRVFAGNIPEPGTLALVAGGLFLLGLRRRR